MKLKADKRMPGLYLRTLDSGSKSYVVVSTDLNGKRAWQTVGGAATMTVAEARESAMGIIQAIKSGGERHSPQTVEAVAADFVKRHVQKRGLRSEGEIRRYIDKHILPAWRGRDFTGIRRGDVAKLLDKVEDNAGPVAADKVLAHITTMCRWYATRHDDYTTPIVPKMRRSNPKERAGKRILTDAEIRSVWKQAEANGMFGAFIRLSLLTGQRREKIATMRWQDLRDGVWTIPTAAREKGNAGSLTLPAEAIAILETMPRFASSPYVFTTGRAYFKGYSKAKEAFDAKCPIAAWDIHDLRRTARSLMSRAGVQPLIAELTLGHVQQGVQGIYDRHSYVTEKAQALTALAGLLANILRPESPKVVSLRG
jgi:integrase